MNRGNIYKVVSSITDGKDAWVLAIGTGEKPEIVECLAISPKQCDEEDVLISVDQAGKQYSYFLKVKRRLYFNRDELQLIGQVADSDFDQLLRRLTIMQATHHYKFAHEPNAKPFKPGDRISYAGRVFDQHDVAALVDSSLDFWLTAGRYALKFEEKFAEFVGVRYCSLVNSGSSANLLAFMALTSPELGEKRIKPGDEVITVAAGFPTTVAPIVQYGAIPVFVDVMLPSYNIDCSQLEAAVSNKTKAVFLAHTLGNPFDIDKVALFCEKYQLWLIEDNCDALGSRYNLEGTWRHTGTFGHLATSSFYPPHHITMGEGGAVYTNDVKLKRLVESFRDWGRDCWCPPGQDDTCTSRFSQQFGALPLGYDHKYVYSHFGYNLKATDLQAAIGCAQLEKLPAFIEKRRQNWQYLRQALDEFGNRFILPEPQVNSEPSWFGFLLTIREDAGISRADIVQHLETKRIQTRLLFAGNLIKHPCFDEMRKSGQGYRVVGDLQNTDLIMNNTFWLGVYPGLDEARLDFMVEQLKQSVADNTK